MRLYWAKWTSRLNSAGQLVLLGLFTLNVVGCSEPSIQKLEGFAQGTTYHISYWSDLPVNASVVKKSVEQTFEVIDKELSNYRPDSVIEAFNTSATTDSQAVGTTLVSLVKIAQVVNKTSEGCYDLTIKPLFDLWGFRGEALTIPTNEMLKQTLAKTGIEKVRVVDASHLQKQQADISIDSSSIAQGYSVARISSILEQQGITNYLVEIGGELQTQGHKPDSHPWRIALERPLPGKQTLQKIITLPKDTPTAVMTSGTYRHYFDADGHRYSHILDARDGKPVTHNLVSVTVIHPDPTLADAWSTALLCLGEPAGIKIANAENLAALFITQTGEQLVETTSDALCNSTAIVIQ